MAISGFPDATVEMVSRGTQIDLLAHTSADGGTLARLRFATDFTPGAPVLEDQYATPGQDLNQVGSLDGVPRKTIAATLDQNGFPVAAATLLEPGTRGFFRSVVLARPADALDDDGDGIPLLLEAAHCLDVNRKNPLSETAQGQAERFNFGGWDLSFDFRLPAATNTRTRVEVRSGEFVYQYQAGNDLIGWAEDSSFELPGVDRLVAFTALDPICNATSIGLRYQPEFIAANPRRFARLQISRDR